MSLTREIQNPAFGKKFTHFLFAFLSLGFSLTTCFLVQNKDKRSEGPKIIIRDSLVLDRLPTGETVRISFKTKTSAKCELTYWTQEKNLAPSKESPVIIPCSGALGQTTFVETLSNLSASTLYTFRISAWKLYGGKAAADSVVIKENDGNGVGKDVIVVRLNNPLRTTEIHAFRSPVPMELDHFKKALQKELGCKSGIPSNSSIFAKASSLDVGELSSQGYATSTAEKHTLYKNRLRLNYNAFQNESRWEWQYENNGTKFDFLARQAAEIYQVEMKSATKRKFAAPSLARSENILAVNPTLPFTIKWSADNLAEISYVTVQIGNHSINNSFFCVFNARNSVGVIEPQSNLLNKLNRGDRYDVVVTLYSAQLLLFPSTGKTPWLIASYDWRSAMIQRI